MSGPDKVDLHDVTLVCEDGEKVVTHLQTDRQPPIFQLLSLHTTPFQNRGGRRRLRVPEGLISGREPKQRWTLTLKFKVRRYVKLPS